MKVKFGLAKIPVTCKAKWFTQPALLHLAIGLNLTPLTPSMIYFSFGLQQVQYYRYYALCIGGSKT